MKGDKPFYVDLFPEKPINSSLYVCIGILQFELVEGISKDDVC